MEDFEGELDFQKLIEDLTDLIIKRENEGKGYGIICLAEGLSEKLPLELKPKGTDEHGNPLITETEISKIVSKKVKKLYKEKTGQEKRVLPKQIGYEIRAAAPISYDIVLGSMLGYGAYKLASEKNFGNMVSVKNNFDIYGIPFNELIDPKTLRTKLRPIPRNSDFFKLKNALTYR